MDIIVEIGTLEQQGLIRQELRMFEICCEEIPGLSVLEKVVVPLDFDKTVNDLEGFSSYVSDRGRHIGIARIVEKNGRFVIVINPVVYTGKNDSHIRYFYFFHELMHVLNGVDVKPRDDESTVISRKRVNLAIFFDEYCANRSALEVHSRFFPSPSFVFKRRLIFDFNSYLTFLVDDSEYYSIFCELIWNFRTRKIDVNSFLRNVKEPFDQVLKTVAYVFAYIDSCPHFAKREGFLVDNSNFVNYKTLALIDYVRGKFAANDFDVSDGLDLMEDFMTNFGMRFDDLGDGGEYLHVLDI